MGGHCLIAVVRKWWSLFDFHHFVLCEQTRGDKRPKPTAAYSAKLKMQTAKLCYTPPKRVHVLMAKAVGATMWFWIFWRLKHDWRDFTDHHAHVVHGIEERKRQILASREQNS